MHNERLNNLTIRTATAGDIETIAANNLAMAEETEGRGLDPETVQAGVARVLSDAQRGVYYLAEHQGKVVGQLLITREWSDWRDAWFWWIQSVFVTRQARRRGVYRALQHHVIAAARAEPDVCGVRLYVAEENSAAQRTYERLGMIRTGYRFYEIDWRERPDATAGGAGHGE